MKPSGNLSVWPQCGHYTTTIIVIWATTVNEEAQEQPQVTDLQSIPCVPMSSLCTDNDIIFSYVAFTFDLLDWLCLQQQYIDALHVRQQCDSRDEIVFLIFSLASMLPCPITKKKKSFAKRKTSKTTKDTRWKHNSSSRQWLKNVPLR